MRLVLQRAPADCGVAALATWLEQSYEDVYLAVSSVERKSRGKCGLNLAQIERAAKVLGVRLTRKPKPNLDDDDGLLVVNWQKGAHMVVLGHGVIADPADGWILPAEEYLAREQGRAGMLLTEGA